MNEPILEFQIQGRPISTVKNGHGHINGTFLVATDAGKSYTLQKINQHVFPDVDGLMSNIAGVTDFLRKSSSGPREVLNLVRTRDGKPYYRDENGACWRVFEYISDVLCLDMPETAEDFYQSAVAFGTFQQRLAKYPVETLIETIPKFHDTEDRYLKFRAVLEKDPCGRAESVRDEIRFALSREKEAGVLCKKRADGTLPTRVTHNDTKLNNVLLDAETRTALCVIDLDTVMPGLSLYDYGDSIRFGASTGAEDELDLSKVSLDIGLFRAYTRGYASACPKLTEAERLHMPDGARIMTLECGVRFLTDYLDGDHYFGIHREGHNLDRARAQFRLVSDMEDKWNEMAAVVKEEAYS